MAHFGTDGIRCKAEAFSDTYLTKITLGIVNLGCKKVIIGRDPRVSGPRIEKIMSEILRSYGTEVLVAGMIPTPVLSFLTRKYECDYGIMLSASHNPPEYNGIKLFSSHGSKVAEWVEKSVEKFIDEGGELPEEKDGSIEYIDGGGEYIEYLLTEIKPDLTDMKIALDTANGATSMIAPELFRRAGATVTSFFGETDGVRINENCGATVPKTLASIMADGGYDLGFTYDGDGDRVMCVEGERIYNGDHVMYVHCKVMKEKGSLVGNVMVGTVMSNMGTEVACRKHGITLLRTGVGDKNVYREMEKHGYNVGGEESGHIIFTDYMPTGDGILASLLTAVLAKERSISSLDDIVEYPSISDCIICGKAEIEKFKGSEKIARYIENISDYRTVIRPSGTEPKIRILVEGEDKDGAIAKCAEIKKFIEEIIYESI